jgi:hypothetical protein
MYRQAGLLGARRSNVNPATGEVVPEPAPRQATDDPERAALVAELAKRKNTNPEAFDKVPTSRLAEMLKEAA